MLISVQNRIAIEISKLQFKKCVVEAVLTAEWTGDGQQKKRRSALIN